MNESASPLKTCGRCGGQLRANAPEGLCPRCLGGLNLAGETLFTETEAPRIAAPSIEQVAADFPQLEILECLGRGGMGIVYKARQKSLNRLVALKLLAPERAHDAMFAQRFSQEAQALAALHHPNIVTIHDFGQAGECYFLLMEFVDGVNLRQAMRADRFTPAQALAIVPPVCEALQFAHEHGIVHRDIKPENLLLDRQGRVKIVDFGIATMLGQSCEAEIAGTPQYMAPEQKQRRTTDHRADIYSLGVVLYELLTGELPAAEMQPPSRKVQIDVRLDEIVLRALHERPDLRYRTASDFKTQVESVVIGAQKVPPASPQPRQRRIFRRHVLAATASLLVLIGFSAAVFFAPRDFYSQTTISLAPTLDLQNPDGHVEPNFVAHEAQEITRTEVLYPVMTQLGLGKESHTREVGELIQKLEVREVRNTRLLEIGIYDRDSQVAAKIANTFAQVYRDKRMSDLQRIADRTLHSLEAEVERQQKEAEAAAAEMARIREQEGIIDPDPERPDASRNVPKAGRSDYAEVKRRYLRHCELLNAAKQKLTNTRIELADATKVSPVRIVEHAEPEMNAKLRLGRLWNLVMR